MPGDASAPLERERIEETLFDWRTWQLAAGSGVGLHLLWAAVRHAAARWIDSQLWLVERNLPWIGQVEPADAMIKRGTSSPAAGLVEHLAAQLAVALRPFAGNEIVTISKKMS